MMLDDLLAQLTKTPDDPNLHHQIANLYAKQQRYDEALTYYHQALQLAPDDADIHFHLGLLFLKQQQFKFAKIQFQNVLVLNDAHPHAYFQLGAIYLLEEAFEDAKRAFQHVLILNPNEQDAMTNLGVIALKQLQDQLAIDYFTKTLLINEQNINARNNLAATFMHHDRYENALMHYDVLLQNDTTNSEYLYNSGVAEMALGHLEKAISYFERTLQKSPHHTDSLTNLAAIYLKLNDKPKAQNLLQQVVSLNPNDEIAQHMLKALVHEPNAATCPNYAKNLFNNYALYYEQHLNKSLHYSLPDKFDAIIEDLNLPPIKTILELGCGTGIMGERLKTLGDYLIGVDIAPKMLAEAQKKNVYDELIEADIITYLNQISFSVIPSQHSVILSETKDLPALTPQQLGEIPRFARDDVGARDDTGASADVDRAFNLVIAADVFPYIGKLDVVFEPLSRQMPKAAILIFSTEISENADFELNPTARFSHHQDYLTRLAHQFGFDVLHLEKIIGREQDHEPVNMWLMAFKKIV